jgi:T-complex protein 1 subunit alpha
MAALQIHGERQSGQDVRSQNTVAALAIANVLKTSLGPVGLDKMLVDDIGDVTITNDGATILKLLEVEHPAAKILVELAELQDHEVGDGTTSVVILACELLRRANELVKAKIHPTSIIGGYRMAMKEACRAIRGSLCIDSDSLGEDVLMNAARTSMSSKIIGADSDHFARLAVDAVRAVASVREDGTVHYPIGAINVLKAQGKNIRESRVLDGYALLMGRAAQGMPKSVPDARIACLDMNLQKARMAMGVQVLVTDPAELEKIRQRESDITRERIRKILDAGANVVLTTKGIDDTCLKYFVEAGAMACRRVPRDDLRRVARMTGATVVSTLADEEGDESFSPEALGSATEVYEDTVADGDVVLIKKEDSAVGKQEDSAATVLVRGANEYLLDEVDRSLHDAFCIVKRVLESGRVVAGGGAVEAALSVHLERHSRTLEGREQVAIAEFADALLVIPKTLAVNAAKDAIELVAQLRAKHFAGESRWGLDLAEGTARDNVAAGVVEPMLSKVKIVQFATEAAVTILRIDDDIRLQDDDDDGE